MFVAKVWVLFLISSMNSTAAVSFTVDNISTREECNRLGNFLTERDEKTVHFHMNFRCAEVEKSFPVPSKAG
jgi:hypothetical protein